MVDEIRRDIAEDDVACVADHRQRPERNQAVARANIEQRLTGGWSGAPQHALAVLLQLCEPRPLLVRIASMASLEDPLRPLVALSHAATIGEPRLTHVLRTATRGSGTPPFSRG